MRTTHTERTRFVAWCLCCVLASRAWLLVEASAAGASPHSHSSSLFGVLGRALCGGEGGDDRNRGLPRSLPYVRLGRLPLWNGSSGPVPEPRRDAFTPDERTVPQSFRSRSRRRFGHGLERRLAACLEASLSTVSPVRTGMTLPIIPLGVDMDEQTCEEFADDEALDLLVESGLEMASGGDNDWIEWKMHGSTKKLMEENDQSETAVLEKGEVMVYIGKAKREGHGSNLPIIKTKSILPLAAEEMADLLMDSSRVKIYNKLSVGRTDVRTIGEGTKVVCNLTKPPIAKSNMVSCTLMHSRKLEEGSAHFVVSRAAPGMVDESLSELPRNDILLGVNLLEDHGPGECVMTAVTHVYSPALPTMLAKKMGVSSAINFVKDIRNSCIGSKS